MDENKDGLIVRGAKMLATHGPTADELMIYPQPGIRAGEERYVLAFAVPTATRGLRFICREPFDAGEQSEWDHPLGARFEEPDAVCVFDDVLVPWDRVFLHGDVRWGMRCLRRRACGTTPATRPPSAGWRSASSSPAWRLRLTRAVKSDAFLHVQEQLGELLGYLQLIEAAILMSERNAEPTGRGAVRPAYDPLQALRYHLPRMYERMVQVTQVLGAGGLLINPDAGRPALGDRRPISRATIGAPVSTPSERIRLSKLAWDVTGTQFGQRMLQYERYYAGDPVRVGASYYLDHDVAPLLAQVERALRS